VQSSQVEEEQRCSFSCINTTAPNKRAVMVNPNRFYTYAYLREDRTPYYIGKGTKDRAYKDDSRCCARPPKNRILILKNNLTEEQAYKHEVYMINHYGRKIDGGILHNINEGGELTPNHKGKKYWTNGITNKMSYDCPDDGWILGRTTSKIGLTYKKGLVWWNNGKMNTRSSCCPGEGWIRGMMTNKVYELYSPDGKIYRTKNISIFCKEHNISTSHMINVCNGERKTTCGWKGKVLSYL